MRNVLIGLMEGFSTMISAIKVFGSRLCLLLIVCSLSYCSYAGGIGVNGGDFIFEYEISGQTKKIPVYYFSPRELSPLSRVVFVLHGAGRQGRGYRDEWQKYAVKYNFLVLCPEFSETEFKGWGKYNAGNIYDYEQKRYTSREEWSFNVIEGLFDFVKQQKELKAETYCIFGHSAGAQFVQRMVLFMPEARFSLAIANGAGGYTLPVFDKKFPDGVQYTCVTEESVKKSFAKEMIVLMGDRDLVSKTMPKEEGQFHEYDRVWRAKAFYKTAKDEALKLGVPFKWRFGFVPNADHNNPQHAEYGSRFAARSKIFLSNPRIGETKDAADSNESGLTDSNMSPEAK